MRDHHDVLGRKLDQRDPLPGETTELFKRSNHAFRSYVETEQLLHERLGLLDETIDAVFLQNLQGKIIYCNKTAENLYGLTSAGILTKSSGELLCKNNRDRYEVIMGKVMEDGRWSGEIKYRKRDGKNFIVDTRWLLLRDNEGIPSKVAIIVADISEKKRLEQDYLRVQRLESIGTIAGGIVHDLNNVLAPIMMAVQMLRSRATDDQTKRLIDLLETSTERGSKMVKQVLSFVGGIGGERIDVNLSRLFQEVESIIRDTFPKSIDVTVDVAPELWTVSADPTQLHQVLMNLAVNARDAMPDGGRITLGARNAVFDLQSLTSFPELKPGPHVVFTVSDSGAGIPPELLEKIFEPFYTTKGAGKGTGIGLSTVISIVKSHGGIISVDSELGRGSSFTITFPAIQSKETTEAERQTRELPSGAGETILVVDDEAIVREITTSTLKMYGYEVMTASDGSEAVSIYAEHKHSISAVVSDMDMPIMDGRATAQALKRLNPQVKLILVSGSSGGQNKSADHIQGIQAFLQKPFTAEKLLITLKEVLTKDGRP